MFFHAPPSRNIPRLRHDVAARVRAVRQQVPPEQVDGAAAAQVCVRLARALLWAARSCRFAAGATPLSPANLGPEAAARGARAVRVGIGPRLHALKGRGKGELGSDAQKAEEPGLMIYWQFQLTCSITALYRAEFVWEKERLGSERQGDNRI